MKKFLIIGGIVLVIVGSIISVIILMQKLKPKKIENINYLFFTYSTGYHMYGYVTYLVECKDKCTLSIKPEGVADEERQTVEISKEDVKEIEEKLNEYNIASWNGFNKIDKNVLDGDSFTLTIKYNEEEIHAHGYMSWPSNYANVKSYLDNKFNEYKKEK